ncbi:MAG: hypothetical protein AB7V77_03190 [Candidatus Woesearchaeota archaeon]
MKVSNISKILYVLIISMTFLSLFSDLASADYNLPCCIPQVFDSFHPSPICQIPQYSFVCGEEPILDYSIQQSNCCDASNQFNPVYTKVGCCCNGNVPTYLDYTSTNDYGELYLVTEVACEDRSSSYNFVEESDPTKCSQICSGQTGTTTPTYTNFVQVNGFTFGEFEDGTKIELSNVAIDVYDGNTNINTFLVQNKYNYLLDNQFCFNSTHENVECARDDLPKGVVLTFRASLIDDSEYLDDYPNGLNCNLPDNYNFNFQTDKNDLELVLDCEELSAPCTPVWVLDCENNDDCYTISNSCQDYTDNYGNTDGIKECLTTQVGEDDGWGECVQEGLSFYQSRQIHDLNHCGIIDGKPATIRYCDTFEPEESLCHNGQIDVGEDCDFDATTGDEIYPTSVQLNDEGIPSCSYYSGLMDPEEGVSGVTCSQNCKVDLLNCLPACGPVCLGGTQCEVCPNCIGATNCDLSCNNEYPTFMFESKTNLTTFTQTHTIQLGTKQSPITNIFDNYLFNINKVNYLANIKFFEMNNDVQIEWNFNSSCNEKLAYHEISMCEVTETNGNYICNLDDFDIIRTPNKNWVFENSLKAGKTYCFDVCSYIKSPSTTPIKNCYSELLGEGYENGICVKIPTEADYCMDEHPEGMNCVWDGTKIVKGGCAQFADYIPATSSATLKTLTNLTLTKISCANDELCVETQSSPGAICKDEEPCWRCNGLFGLFSTYSLSTQKEDGFVCEDFQNINGTSQSELEDEENPFKLCYKDESLTTLPKFDSCNQVKSCYDYKSNYACENDPCFKFSEIQNGVSANNECAWTWYDKELGIGVCKSTIEEHQECTRCEKDSPIGYCNEDLCQNNYGECYFKDELVNSNLSIDGELKNYLKNLEPNRNTNPNQYTPRCIAKQDMACVLYDKKEDCIGGTTEQSFVLNSIYESNDSTYGIGNALINSNPNYVLSGNNEKTSSNDYFKFGTCVWNDEIGCHKNSDYNYEITNNNDVLIEDDCDFSNLILLSNCIKDNITPTTTFNWESEVDYTEYNENYPTNLPIYGANQIHLMSFSVEDNVWKTGSNTPTFGDIDTFVTFLKVNDSNFEDGDLVCYNCNLNNEICTLSATADVVTLPSDKSSFGTKCELYPNTKIYDVKMENFFSNSGIYLMKYFSQDRALNMEEVQEKLIYVDAEAPEINYSELQETGIISIDNYKTNLTIQFNTSEMAYCTANLTKYVTENQLQNIQVADIVYQFNDTFKTTYYYLYDGLYNMNIACKDIFGNINVEDHEIFIEGDKSIYNVSPRGEVYLPNDASNVLLELSTIANSTCRFAINYPLTNGLPSFRDMETKCKNCVFNSQSADKVILTSQGLVTIEDEEVENSYHYMSFLNAIDLQYEFIPKTPESKTYSIYTACQNKDTNELTEKSPADTISLTIDGLPPTSNVLENENQYQEDYVEYANERILTLTCDDTNPNSYNQFGCNKIYYCLSDNNLARNQTFNNNKKASLSKEELENYCQNDNLKQTTENELDLTISYIRNDLGSCSNCYLMFYSDDEGQNTESLIHVVNPKVRDVKFDEAKVYAYNSTNQQVIVKK